MYCNTDKIFEILPSLRRYALALAGTEAAADDLLENTIEWMLANPDLENGNFESFAILGDINQIQQARQWPENIEVSEALNNLPFLQRKCLIMSTVEEKSYSRIAASKNISVNEVRDHVSQARIALADRFLDTRNSSLDEKIPSQQRCSDRHLSALLDNELSSTDALLVRTALGFDQQLAKSLEELALVDTLVASSVTDIEQNQKFIPMQAQITHASHSSAYLH